MSVQQFKLPQEGTVGVATIKHFTVNEDDASFSRLRYVATGGREQPVEPGVYARLSINGALVMSSTQSEASLNWRIMHMAHGDVLIAGLGLGFILPSVLALPMVSSVTLVEKETDVVTIITPSLPYDARLSVIVNDIFTWRPPKGRQWDTIYFDIWNNICYDNLPEIRRLERRFRPRLRKGGWMNSWAKRKCMR